MDHDLVLRRQVLYQFWERTSNSTKGKPQPLSVPDWNQQVYFLSGSGVGTEEALQYICTKRPSFDAFIDWLQHTYQPGTLAQVEQTDDVLTQEDLDFWNTNGYLVVKDAVTQAQCQAARTAIWECLDAQPQDTQSWYKTHPLKNGLMVSLFQHPALDSVRRSPKIRKAYEQVYNSKDIYLLVDKVSFNPPEGNSYKFMGSPLHWDVSLQLPIPFALQGMLYLTNTCATDGAFHCVPGFHNTIADWLATVPYGEDPRAAALQLQPIPVPGNAGDLVIWHQALPHCATPNKGITPRMVQYIAYKPIKEFNHDIWK